MPSKKRSYLLLSPFWALLLAACVLPGASALGVTMWQVPGSGDWSHGANWTLGEPDLGNPNTRQAHINNGGTAIISSLGENCERLDVADGGAGSAGHVIMNGGSLLVSWQECIGAQGTGSFHQIAGTHSTGGLYLGDDSANASYVMTGGTLSGGGLSVGQRGAATFTHSNGLVSVDGIAVRAGAGLTSRYDLSGLGVVDTGQVSVSSGGLFEQIGGSLSVGGNLAVGITGGTLGTYNLAGGSLTAGAIQIGGKYGGPGQFNITNASARIRAEYSLLLYADAILSAVPGTKIHLGGNPNGAWFDNRSQNPSNLAGLRNVTLIYDGGEQWDWDGFEVAAADLGPTVEGYEAGFELAKLAVGGSISRLRLMDYRTNQPGGGDAAVYVRHLYVGPGSTLDLNGHTLYYMHADIDPDAEIILRGGALIQSEVPEPTTLALLAIGGLLLVRRRR